MAFEAILLTDGVSLVSTADYRNSTSQGTTYLGPNGSAQFLAVRMSTVTAGVGYITTAAGIAGYGVLQNKPAVGDVMSVAVFGISKVVAGSTAITAGGDLEVTSSGVLIPYSSAAGVARFARQVGPVLPTAVGEVFSAFIYGIAGSGVVT